jgi:uncharacterized membrane protein
MTFYILALLIGIVAGLRNMTAAAAVSWAAYLGWLPLQGTSLAFLGAPITPYIFTVLAIAELFADQWSKTPSRKAPPSFAIRLVVGAISGAAIGTAGGALVAGLVLGVIGAIIGTLGGYAARLRLANALGRDLPAALIEDVIAVVGAVLIVGAAK